MTFKKANIVFAGLWVVPMVVSLSVLFITYTFWRPGALPPSGEGSLMDLLKYIIDLNLPYIIAVITSGLVLTRAEKIQICRGQVIMFSIPIDIYQLLILGSIIRFIVLYEKVNYDLFIGWLNQWQGFFKYILPSVLTIFYLYPHIHAATLPATPPTTPSTTPPATPSPTTILPATPPTTP